jgi:hypothetical protein
MAEFNLEGLLGNAFGGGSGNFLNEYLTPEQIAAMQRNAMLAASAALLKAGGENTRRIGIGEALGGAFEAGQAGYEKAQTGALTQMAMKQKMDEAKKAKELQKLIAGVFAPQAAAPAAMQTAVTPEPLPQVGDPYLRRSIIDNPVRQEDQAPAGQMEQRYVTQADLDQLKNYQASQVRLPTTAQAAAMPMNPNIARANQYRQAAQMLNMAGQGEQAMKYEDLAQKLDPRDEVQGAPFEGTNAQGNPIMLQQMKDGTIRPIVGVGPKQNLSEKARQLAELGLPLTLENFQLLESSPNEIKLLNKMGMPVTMANVERIRRSGAASTVVNMNEGQKGFENEMKLASAFRGEPIYKDFNDMQSAYGQVISSLAQGTPIGDVAGATKVMKLLDPGSVVRESELGIAMASAGRMDRLKNYFNSFMTGQKLTPTQRQDFNSLSNELYAAAGQAYNQKRNEYLSVGQTYKFPNINTVLGAPANVPSIVRQPGGPVAAPGMGGGRPTLNNIFGAPGN